MDQPARRPDIFDYTDYRKFLEDWFEARKATNPRFSHRLFARLAGQRSSSGLLNVVQRRRNLSAESVESFARAMRLSAGEAAFFRALVAFDQAGSPEAKTAAWTDIAATRRVREARHVDGDGYRYLAHWYYPAIRELAGQRPLKHDPEAIAALLCPKVPVADVAAAVREMLDLELLRDSDGELVATDVTVMTPPEVLGDAVHAYHRGMIDLARESIGRFRPEERHLLGATVSVPRGRMADLKRMLNQFQAQVLEFCDASDEPSDRVCQVNLHLFPLSDVVEDR